MRDDDWNSQGTSSDAELAPRQLYDEVQAKEEMTIDFLETVVSKDDEEPH